MINDPTQGGRARQPRGIIKITAQDASGATVSGEVMPGWAEFDVNNNVFAQADTFRCRFAISGLPDNRREDWWAKQETISVEIRAGFPANPENYNPAELPVLILGTVDEIELDAVGRMIDLHGRDLTARMVDGVTTEKWQNLTSSSIAGLIADRHGFQKAITATKTRVGDYYQIENASISDQSTEWDMLNWLAGLEQFVVYMAGETLHFEPRPRPSDDPYVLKWIPPNAEKNYHEFNGTRLRFSRDLTVARGIVVTVNSFSQRAGKVSQSYPANPRKNAQKYTVRVANLNNEQALQKAQAIHKERSAHEVRLHAEMPADTILTTANIIRVEGTGTAYDQIYYPDSITRSMSIHEGYVMHVSAKNHSTDNEVQ